MFNQRRHFLKKTLWACSFSLTVFVPLSARAENPPPLPKVVRIAADFTSMPWYGFDSKTGKQIGFEADFAEIMFKSIDPTIKIEFVPLQWARIEDAIVRGEADIGSGGFFLPPPSEQKPEKLAWSDCYMTTSLAIIYLKKNGRPRSIDDLKKKRITIFTDEAAVAVMKEAGITKYSQSTFDYKFAEYVANGKTDFGIIDDVGAQFMSQKYSQKVAVENTLFKKYSANCYAVFARKSDSALIKEINAKGIPAIIKQKKDILRKYGLVE
jgi:ABC-type amino acid transport substrate-binding protein